LRSVNSPKSQIYKLRKFRKIRSIKQTFIIKKHLKILKWSSLNAGNNTCEQQRKMTGSTSYVLHKKTNVTTAVESYCERKTVNCRRASGKFRSLQLRLLSSLASNNMYLGYIFHFNIDIALFLW